MRRYNRLSYLLWTTRYLHPGQVYSRLKNMVRRFWRKNRRSDAGKIKAWELGGHKQLYAGLTRVSDQGPWTEAVSNVVKKAENISELRFNFLYHNRDFGKRIDWHDKSVSQLWRYHLHYFEYITDLLVWSFMGYSHEAYLSFQNLVDSWILGNQKLSGDGWHPFTISLRVVNWIHALSGFQQQLSENQQFNQRFLNSLYEQGRILAKELEFDVRGNHLLKNLKALIWLGIVFKGARPEKWLNKALRLLECELEEQILVDGGHFERTPGYHLIVLRDCLEIGIWMRHNRGLSFEWLDAHLHRMMKYLLTLLSPDGNVPLLKDTAWDAAPKPEDLLTVGALYFDDPIYKYCDEFGLYPFLLFGMTGQSKFEEWPLNKTSNDSSALPQSGFYVMRDDSKKDYLVLDMGKPCPDYLPAHAHADMLSYELTVNGQRIIVDSGVFEYSAGPWRDFFRSTRAHNTVEVEGEDQSEVWDSFRVARRARPGKIVWRSEDQYVLAQGAHDGYRRLSVPVLHRRTLVWQKGFFWLVVDELFGDGAAKAANRVHLNPQLQLLESTDSTWQIKGCNSSLWLNAFGEQNHSIVRGQSDNGREGWYSEKFGSLVPNTVLILDKEDKLPFCYGYVISIDEPVKVVISVSQENYFEIAVSLAQNWHELKLGRGGVAYSQ